MSGPVRRDQSGSGNSGSFLRTGNVVSCNACATVKWVCKMRYEPDEVDANVEFNSLMHFDGM